MGCGRGDCGFFTTFVGSSHDLVFVSSLVVVKVYSLWIHNG